MSRKRQRMESFDDMLARVRGLERSRDYASQVIPPTRTFKTGKELHGKSDRKNIELQKRSARLDMSRDDF